MERRRIVVEGRVQGVGFRAWTSDRARRAGVTGWVANEWDGSVTVEVQGSAEEVEAFASLLTAGSGPAGRPGRVTGSSQERMAPDETESGFERR